MTTNIKITIPHCFFTNMLSNEKHFAAVNWCRGALEIQIIQIYSKCQRSYSFVKSQAWVSEERCRSLAEEKGIWSSFRSAPVPSWGTQTCNQKPVKRSTWDWLSSEFGRRRLWNLWACALSKGQSVSLHQCKWFTEESKWGVRAWCLGGILFNGEGKGS